MKLKIPYHEREQREDRRRPPALTILAYLEWAWRKALVHCGFCSVPGTPRGLAYLGLGVPGAAARGQPAAGAKYYVLLAGTCQSTMQWHQEQVVALAGSACQRSKKWRALPAGGGRVWGRRSLWRLSAGLVDGP